MHLTTPRLHIRFFEPADLDAYAAIVADAEVMAFLGGPQTRAQASEYLSEMIELSATKGLGRYAVVDRASSRLLGFCGFRPAGDTIDLGYRFDRATWGQGIGLEAAKAVRGFGLSELGMTNMEAGAAVSNVASIRILQQLDFRFSESVTFDGAPSIRFRDRLAAD